MTHFMTNNEVIFWSICFGLGLLFLSYRTRKTRRTVRQKQKQERELTLTAQRRALLHAKYEAYNKEYISLEYRNYTNKEIFSKIKEMLSAYIKADNLKDKEDYLCFVQEHLDEIKNTTSKRIALKTERKKELVSN